MLTLEFVFICLSWALTLQIKEQQQQLLQDDNLLPVPDSESLPLNRMVACVACPDQRVWLLYDKPAASRLEGSQTNIENQNISQAQAKY